MQKIVLACCLFATAAFAADAAKAPEAAKPADAAAPQWKPVVAKKKDVKGVEAFYKAMDEAAKKGDLEALAGMHDFPVMMLTDNSAGVPSGDSWTKEQWMNVMKPAFENMPKDMKHTIKAKVTSWVSDSIAFVDEQHTRTVGKGKPETFTDATILVLKDGKWMIKAGAEAGWGDMMAAGEKKTEAAPAKDAPGTKTAAAPENKPAAQPAAQPAPAKK